MTTCSECSGPVNVPSGERLRCGCGKTYADPDKHAELRAILGICRANRVQQYSAVGLTLVLHPDAWKTEAVLSETVSTTGDPSAHCACGHHLGSEHNDTGCLMGCAIEVCESTQEKAA